MADRDLRRPLRRDHHRHLRRASAIFGDLRNDGTSFVSWFPFHQQKKFWGNATEEFSYSLLPHKIGDFISKWEDPYVWSDRLDPGFLDYKYEDHGADNDPLGIAAMTTAQSPVFKTTINVTLAIRRALRRYLGIEPAVPNSEWDNPHGRSNKNNSDQQDQTQLA